MAFDYSPEMADRYYAEYPLSGGGWFAVCDGVTSKLVGRVGLLSRGDLYIPPEIELAYGIGERFRGNGYATEAAKALVRYAAEDLRLHQCFAGIAPDNPASRRVAEKCGLAYERAVQWYGKEHMMYWYRANPRPSSRR